jgi:hypothetical protein
VLLDAAAHERAIAKHSKAMSKFNSWIFAVKEAGDGENSEFNILTHTPPPLMLFVQDIDIEVGRPLLEGGFNSLVNDLKFWMCLGILPFSCFVLSLHICLGFRISFIVIVKISQNCSKLQQALANNSKEKTKN